MREELTPTGITVQTINPGPYDTGFNDGMADTTYKWPNDAVNFEREADIKANFARILKGQLDPQDMIDRMVFVIGSDRLPSVAAFVRWFAVVTPYGESGQVPRRRPDDSTAYDL